MAASGTAAINTFDGSVVNQGISNVAWSGPSQYKTIKCAGTWEYRRGLAVLITIRGTSSGLRSLKLFGVSALFLPKPTA